MASFDTAPSLLRVFDTARRYIAYRERESAIATGTIPAPRNLAEAIDRDFLAFELRRAERDLREAVVALDPHVCDAATNASTGMLHPGDSPTGCAAAS